MFHAFLDRKARCLVLWQSLPRHGIAPARGRFEPLASQPRTAYSSLRSWRRSFFAR